MYRYACCFVLLLAMSLLAAGAGAAEVSSEHFSLTVPEGWVKADETPDDGVFVAVLQESATGCMVSVTVRPAAMSAKELCDETVGNMKGKGFKMQEPVQDGASWRISFSQKRTGMYGEQLFSAAGGTGTILSVFATRADLLDHARTVLRENFRPVNGEIFPTAF